jgi:exopolyphosphatase/guanosine-5'-triphosphate,3'-diphosphate pyrophosphatase
MNLLKKITISFIILAGSLRAGQENRCAVDIGSGWIKMQTALVDTENNRIIRLLDEPFLAYVPLANYYAQDSELSPVIQQKAIAAFGDILKICTQKNISKISGVATEIFRKAGDSGATLFNTLQTMAEKQFGKAHVKLQIVSQDVEGHLGFLTAAALSPELDINNIVSWDSGNASFQFVVRCSFEGYTVFQGKLGCALAAKLFVEGVRKQVYQRGATIGPVTLAEIETFTKLIGDAIPFFAADFAEKRGDKNVLSIGGQTSMFSIASKIIGRNSFSRSELYDALLAYAKLDTMSPQIQQLDAIEPETVIIRLMFLYAVMEKLTIDSVAYKASNGNTLGILLYKPLWDSSRNNLSKNIC